MPLVTPLHSEHDDQVRRLSEFFNETLGFTPNSVLTMQRRPAIAKAFIELNRAVMQNLGRINSEQKRLIALLTSANTGCRYCQAHTALAASRFGASQQRISQIWNFRESDCFSAAEKAAFEFALAASSIPNAVDDQISDELKRHWQDDEIVEILAVVSLFGFLNRWNDSMATSIESPAQAFASTALDKLAWQAGKHQ